MENDDVIGGEHGDCLDRTFDLLRDRNRRLLVYYLMEHDRPVSFKELSTHILQQHTGSSDSEFIGREYSGITERVEKEHLRLLEDYGIVEYDRDTCLIKFIEDSDVMMELIEMAERTER